MDTGKRWKEAFLLAFISGVLAWISNPVLGEKGMSWAELFELKVAIPGLIAFFTTLYAFLQPSTKEGVRSERSG